MLPELAGLDVQPLVIWASGLRVPFLNAWLHSVLFAGTLPSPTLTSRHGPDPWGLAASSVVAALLRHLPACFGVYGFCCSALHEAVLLLALQRLECRLPRSSLCGLSVLVLCAARTLSFVCWSRQSSHAALRSRQKLTGSPLTPKPELQTPKSLDSEAQSPKCQALRCRARTPDRSTEKNCPL